MGWSDHCSKMNRDHQLGLLAGFAVVRTFLMFQYLYTAMASFCFVIFGRRIPLYF